MFERKVNFRNKQFKINFITHINPNIHLSQIQVYRKYISLIKC